MVFTCDLYGNCIQMHGIDMVFCEQDNVDTFLEGDNSYEGSIKGFIIIKFNKRAIIYK